MKLGAARPSRFDFESSFSASSMPHETQVSTFGPGGSSALIALMKSAFFDDRHPLPACFAM